MSVPRGVIRGVGRIYGCLGDAHLTVHPPANCTETYLEDTLGLLKQAFGVFAARKVTAAIIAGDLFHLKAPARTPHWLVEVIGELFLAQPFPVWVTPGNHDMQHDRIESVSKQPLGVLFGLGAAHCLDGWMGGNHPVFGVPWLQHWSEEAIAAALVPWQEQLFGPTLIVTHAPIYPPASEPRYAGAELTPADWWARPLADGSFPHSVFYGHVHASHGAWRRNGLTFANFGALSRGSIGEDNLTRQVGVTLYDESAPGEFEFVALDAKPADQVFRLAEHDKQAAVQVSMETFLASLGATTLARVSPESVMAHVATLPDVPADVSVRVEELMHWAEHEGKPRR
jgi:hypothetical protein